MVLRGCCAVNQCGSICVRAIVSLIVVHVGDVFWTYQKTKVFDQKMTTYPLSTAAENHNLLLCNTRHTSRCLCELKYFTTEGKILVQHDATRRHHHGTKQKRPKRTTHFVQTLSKK